MSEAIAERNEEGAQEAILPFYAFDWTHTEVVFNADPQASAPWWVEHKLSHPSFDDQVKHDDAAMSALIGISRREHKIDGDSLKGDARLWGKIAVAVKGYEGCEDAFRDLSDAEREAMEITHKTGALLRLYAATCRVEPRRSRAIGGGTRIITQLIGVDQEHPDYVVKHYLRTPKETEYRDYKAKASEALQVTGSDKDHLRFIRRLRPVVDTYDSLIEKIEGGTVGGKPWGAIDASFFLRSVDPWWKRAVLDRHIRAMETDFRD